MTTIVPSSAIAEATADITSALREIVEARVDHQMATAQAANVAKLVASGMTVAEIRSRLIAKVMGEEARR